VREGYIYDYVFDWTVLKHQQDEEKERVAAGTVSRGGERREAEEARREAETARRESRHR